MSVISIERRLRKLEARHGWKDGPWFFLWVRSQADAQRLFDALPGPKPTRNVVVVLWPHDEEPPQPRWATARSLSDREFDAIAGQICGHSDELLSGADRDPRAAAMTDDQLLAGILLDEAFQRSALR